MNEKKVLVKRAGAIVLLAVLAFSTCVEGKEAEDTQEEVVTGQTTEDRGGDNGQIIAGLTVTGQATEYRRGDDGTHQAGLSFDYTDNGDGTVTDNNTGLMWAADGNSAGCNNGNKLNWNDAIDWANELNFAGYTDWRLPNVKELHSLVVYEGSSPYINTTYFPNTESWAYWTSTTYAPDADTNKLNPLSQIIKETRENLRSIDRRHKDRRSTNRAMFVDFNSGRVDNDRAMDVYFGLGFMINFVKPDGYRVRAVRGGP